MARFFLIGLTFAFAAAVQPGPLLMYVISQTLSSGWRRTWPAAFAPLLSDIPIALLALGVLSLAPPALLSILQFAGGLFLFYLAVSAFKAWRKVGGEASAPSRGNLFKAALVNLLNPNPYLGWSLVMGPLFLKAWHEAPQMGVALLVGFYGAMIFTTLGIIFLFAAAERLGPRVGRVLLGLSAAALALFALYALWTASTALSAT
jgi:threonine/homoserine/homoserine lactone efflux protein